MYKWISKGKAELEVEDLIDIFPNRRIFCDFFIKMIKRLSFKGKANREGFLFAMEIFLVPNDKVLSETFNHHSFNMIDFFIFIACSEKPHRIVTLS